MSQESGLDDLQARMDRLKRSDEDQDRRFGLLLTAVKECRKSGHEGTEEGLEITGSRRVTDSIHDSSSERRKGTLSDQRIFDNGNHDEQRRGIKDPAPAFLDVESRRGLEQPAPTRSTRDIGVGTENPASPFRSSRDIGIGTDDGHLENSSSPFPTNDSQSHNDSLWKQFRALQRSAEATDADEEDFFAALHAASSAGTATENTDLSTARRKSTSIHDSPSMRRKRVRSDHGTFDDSGREQRRGTVDSAPAFSDVELRRGFGSSAPTPSRLEVRTRESHSEQSQATKGLTSSFEGTTTANREVSETGKGKRPVGTPSIPVPSSNRNQPEDVVQSIEEEPVQPSQGELEETVQRSHQLQLELPELHVVFFSRHYSRPDVFFCTPNGKRTLHELYDTNQQTAVTLMNKINDMAELPRVEIWARRSKSSQCLSGYSAKEPDKKFDESLRAGMVDVNHACKRDIRNGRPCVFAERYPDGFVRELLIQPLERPRSGSQWYDLGFWCLG